jgi:hypothetical protein
MALGYSTRICFLTEASTILSPTTSRMGLWPTQPFIQWMLAGRVLCWPPPTSAEVQNVWGFTSIPSACHLSALLWYMRKLLTWWNKNGQLPWD